MEETLDSALLSAPLPLSEIDDGWLASGSVEFICFICSEHKLRLLGSALEMRDGTA